MQIVFLVEHNWSSKFRCFKILKVLATGYFIYDWEYDPEIEVCTYSIQHCWEVASFCSVEQIY